MIFQKDRAKYTFTEQCEEVPGLHLEDGTTKIFLNMKSKNGSKELVSLLQYMKETNIENPQVEVHTSKILELDEIVKEVKRTEEWEAVQMNILEIGMEEGKRQGETESMKVFIRNLLKRGTSDEEICELVECKKELIDEVRKTL